MIDFYYVGQQAALEKLGYDMDDANRVLQATKKYMLPKASAKTIIDMNPAAAHMGISETGPMTLPGLKNQITNQRKLYRNVINSNKLPSQQEMMEAAIPQYHKDNPVFAGVKSLTNDWKSPMVITPGNMDIRKGLNPYGKGGTKFTPEQNRMLHSIVRGHELDEGLVDPRLSMRGFGHASPEVILREHNRLATLPQEYAPVRELMQNAREGREAEFLKEYGINFGTGERLNRHQRKHLTRLIENKAMADTEAAARSNQEMLASLDKENIRFEDD